MHRVSYGLLWMVGMVLLLANSAMAQEGRVSGRVLSGDTVIAGATVQIKGTTKAVQTDDAGAFSLNAAPDDVLVISYIGFERQEIPVADRTALTIELLPVSEGLGEVVVVGYATQRRETLTGSVSTVAGSEITKSPSSNVTSSLAGRLPGLVVNQRNGQPGRDDPNILIRGNGTFGDNSPLIIIDGVPRSLLGRLNPDDIESISVLKDASAAIYGARAANGVILVTTKSGAKGKANFDLTYRYAFQSPTQLPEMLDAVTFAEAFNEAEWYRRGRPEDFTPFYSADAIQKYRDGSDPVLYPNTDWVGEVLKPHSYQENINLQVNGGTENTRYLLSFGTMGQDGNFRNDPTFYRQYNARVKVDVDILKNLNVGANIYAILNKRQYTPTPIDVNFINILQANPTIIARYPNGLIGPGRLGENPLLLDQRGVNEIDDAPLYSTFTARYQVPFVEGLQLDASYNYDLSNRFEKSFNIPYYFYEYNVNTQEYDRRQGTGTAFTELTNVYRTWKTSLFNFRATYDRRFADKHRVALMLGVEQQQNSYRFASAYRRNFVSTAIDQIDAGSNAAEDKNNSGSASAGAYNNYLGRLNYDFKSKYLFEFLFRYDGSQIFPAGERYGFFPGVSAGWRISEEAFIKDNLAFIDELKVRASYGELGNDRVGQYQYLQSFSFGNNYVFGSQDVPGIFPNTMPNPYITWEVAKKTDLGLEGTFWGGLLGFDFTWWKQNRSNILAARNLSVSNVFGFPDLPDENIGEVNNRGFELLLSHRNEVQQLTYSINANVAFARSNIVFMDEAPRPEPYQNQTGMPVGAGLYYKANGIFRTQEELDSYPHGAGAEVGDIRVVDLNNDGVIDSRDQFRVNYSPTPELVFGLNTNFQYGNFDLNLFFQGQTRALRYDGTAATLGGTDFANAVEYRANDRWTIDNPNGSMPRAGAWQPGNTTFFLFDATFVRLKTAEFGYSLPQGLLTRTKAIKDLRLYVSGFNLLTWSKEIKWSDPEIGGDFTVYPPQRIINLGVNVKF